MGDREILETIPRGPKSLLTKVIGACNGEMSLQPLSYLRRSHCAACVEKIVECSVEWRRLK